MHNGEVFRERVVEAPEQPIAIPEPTPEVGKPLRPEDKLSTETEKSLVLWEETHGKRFVDECFGTHLTSSEFSVKMPTSEIDKYIRGELESRGYEKSVENYRDILREIESEIGSEKLNLMKRFQRITGYIRVLNKIKKARELKEKYLA